MYPYERGNTRLPGRIGYVHGPKGFGRAWVGDPAFGVLTEIRDAGRDDRAYTLPGVLVPFENIHPCSNMRGGRACGCLWAFNLKKTLIENNAAVLSLLRFTPLIFFIFFAR